MKITLHVRYFEPEAATGLDKYDHFTNPLDAFEAGLELL